MINKKDQITLQKNHKQFQSKLKQKQKKLWNHWSNLKKEVIFGREIIKREPKPKIIKNKTIPIHQNSIRKGLSLKKQVETKQFKTKKIKKTIEAFQTIISKKIKTPQSKNNKKNLQTTLHG